MSFVEWSTILSPIIAVLIAVVMIRYNNKDTRKLVSEIRLIAKIHVEMSVKRLELDAIYEQMLASQQKEKHDYFSDNDFARYQQEAADILKDQYDRYEGPRQMSKMHKEYSTVQQLYLSQLKKLASQL